MKMLYSLFSKLQFLTFLQKPDVVRTEARTFFDYSSGEKIKILRAAGREAQKEQEKLLRAYEARFGQAT